MRELFVEKNFRTDTLHTIELANDIISEYHAMGHMLTLRQLYYQFVSRDLIENSQHSYNRLGTTINKGRMAGLIDWSAIEDRTRNTISNSHWDSPQEIINSAADGYSIDMWQNQQTRVEVWIEKEALAGVIEKVCEDNDVPFMACRGYMSQSEQYSAAKRFERYAYDGQGTTIIHLGDHDPSGIDMTRDNQDRLDLMSGYCGVDVVRLALNYDQVEEHNPPPNFAKMTDSRIGGYLANHGDKSWELDALSPPTIIEIVENGINDVRDFEKWAEMVEKHETEQNKLYELAENIDLD